MAARKALPNDHHVLRFASLARRVVHADGTVGGPSPAAFSLSASDKGGLSVTWVEYFGKMDHATRGLAAAAHRESLDSKKLPSQGVFAWALNSDILQAGNEYRKTLRVVHDPVEGNDGHSEVRRFTDEDLDLLEFMSTDVFKHFIAVKDMDIPVSTPA